MADDRNPPKHQAKHFQPEDHAHAAHQEQVSHGRKNKVGHAVTGNTATEVGQTSHPLERAPKGPRKGQ